MASAIEALAEALRSVASCVSVAARLTPILVCVARRAAGHERPRHRVQHDVLAVGRVGQEVYLPRRRRTGAARAEAARQRAAARRAVRAAGGQRVGIAGRPRRLVGDQQIHVADIGAVGRYHQRGVETGRKVGDKLAQRGRQRAAKHRLVGAGGGRNECPDHAIQRDRVACGRIGREVDGAARKARAVERDGVARSVERARIADRKAAQRAARHGRRAREVDARHRRDRVGDGLQVRARPGDINRQDLARREGILVERWRFGKVAGRRGIGQLRTIGGPRQPEEAADRDGLIAGDRVVNQRRAAIDVVVLRALDRGPCDGIGSPFHLDICATAVGDRRRSEALVAFAVHRRDHVAERRIDAPGRRQPGRSGTDHSRGRDDRIEVGLVQRPVGRRKPHQVKRRILRSCHWVGAGQAHHVGRLRRLQIRKVDCRVGGRDRVEPRHRAAGRVGGKRG